MSRMRALVVLVVVVVAVKLAEADRCIHNRCGDGWAWKRCYLQRYTFCVHGGWSNWTVYRRHSCSNTCGTGHQKVMETRTCSNPPPTGPGAKGCSGSNIRTRFVPCKTHSCRVNGRWSEWVESGRTECSKTCGTGSQTITETRTCTNPPPSGPGARPCLGDNSRTSSADCNTQVCPVDGGWSEWAESGRTECSKTCGTGNQTITETRTCTNPPPSGPGARPCSGDSTRTSTADCNTQECAVNGGWTKWTSEEARCSTTCGPGTHIVIKTRKCTNPPPSGPGAKGCSGDHLKILKKYCTIRPCPKVDITSRPGRRR